MILLKLNIKFGCKGKPFSPFNYLNYSSFLHFNNDS